MTTSDKTKELQKQLKASRLEDKAAAEAESARKRQEREAADKAAIDLVKEGYDWTTDSTKHWAGLNIYNDGSAVIVSHRWNESGSPADFSPDELKRLRDYLISCNL